MSNIVLDDEDLSGFESVDKDRDDHSPRQGAEHVSYSRLIVLGLQSVPEKDWE